MILRHRTYTTLITEYSVSVICNQYRICNDKASLTDGFINLPGNALRKAKKKAIGFRRSFIMQTGKYFPLLEKQENTLYKELRVGDLEATEKILDDKRNNILN